LTGRVIAEAKRGPFSGVKRMLEVDAATGRIRQRGKVRLDAGEVVSRAATVGIVTDEQSVLRLANVGPACFGGKSGKCSIWIGSQ